MVAKAAAVTIDVNLASEGWVFIVWS